MEEDDVIMLSQGKEAVQRKLSNHQQDKVEAQISIKPCLSERNLLIEMHSFNIQVKIPKTKKEYFIKRKYSDFQCLFKALKSSYPGCILPYFPAKNIEELITTKLRFKCGDQSKEESLLLRRDELSIFLIQLCCNEQFGRAEELKIFLKSKQEEFLIGRKSIEGQMNQSEVQQSSSSGIISIFERGIAWISNSSHQISENSAELESVEGWQQTEKEIRNWINQICTILEKIGEMVSLKKKEIQWEGSENQLDNVEDLKAKIISGRQYNQIFEEELQENIIKNLQYEVKWLKQIEQQLEERVDICNMINYMYKFSKDGNRMGKLGRKKQRIERNLMNEWPPFRDQMKNKVWKVQKKFNELWRSYCEKISQIWRNR